MSILIQAKKTNYPCGLTSTVTKEATNNNNKEDNFHTVFIFPIH